MRLRIIFAKTDTMRFTSHLDLYRTWERTLRRSRLPLIFSQGFNPRPRIQLAAALPLGFTSNCEIIDVWLTEKEELSIRAIRKRLRQVIPPGISIKEITAVELDEQPLQNLIRLAEYTVILLDPVVELDQKIDNLLAETNIPRERRGKFYNLRPLIKALEIKQTNKQFNQRLRMLLFAQEGLTGRPEEVLSALGIPFERTRIQRDHLLLEG
jgi:radical SAM-linked protein